jgi:hypothetical protein
MNRTNAIICGVVKNCADKIDANMNLAIKTGEQFNAYKLVIYENNSTDKTKELLKKYKTAKIISEDIDPETIRKTSQIWSYKEITGSDHPCRIEQIANARNRVIDEISKPEYDEFTHVVWIDLDSNGWSIEGIGNSFLQTTQWDVIYANGINPNRTYYDMYALRTLANPDLCFGPEIVGEHFWKNLKTNLNFMNESALIPTCSAFGGIGIFKREIFKKYRYDCMVNPAVKTFYKNIVSNSRLNDKYNGLIKNPDTKFPNGYLEENIFWKSNSGYDKPVVCEHVCLNLELYNNGYKMFINPKMLYFR